MSGSRISPSTWYGPLNSRPKSPCSSPWSVVKTTSTSSAQPRAAMAASTRPSASSISSHLDGVAGVDLAHLVGGERGRHPLGRRLVVRHERAVVPEAPVAGLGVEDALALGGRLGVAGRQRHVAPVDAAELGRRRVPRVVRVGEAHPAEPVVVRVEPVEPGDRAIGHPVGVVPARGRPGCPSPAARRCRRRPRRSPRGRASSTA